MGKIVSRLEMDSWWAVARSVRALVAERNALKERLEGNSSRPLMKSAPTGLWVHALSRGP